MNQYDSEYIEYLGVIREMLEDVYMNTVAQEAALAEKDILLLKKLSDERQVRIDAIAAMSGEKYVLSHGTGNSVAETLIRSIERLLKDIELMSASNMEKAKEIKMELSEKILHINTGKKAITSGYFKKTSSQYGSFIDKKVGKLSKEILHKSKNHAG